MVVRLRHVAAAAVAFPIVTSSLSLLHTCLFNDRCWKAHWARSNPVVLERTNWYRFWRFSFYFPVLARSERYCLESWLAVASLFTDVTPESRSRAPAYIYPRVVTHDSLVMLDGAQELRDSTYFLSHFFYEVHPVLFALRREKQGDAVLLHLEMRSDIFLRIPFTNFIFHSATFPSCATLTLEYPPQSHSWVPRCFSSWTRVITVVEHHWFRGRIWSTQTGSMKSVWGDIGDIVRRYNGFLLSLMLTNEREVLRRMTEQQQLYGSMIPLPERQRFELSGVLE